MRTPSLTTADVGARYGFEIGKANVALRARVTNLFNADSWVAARSELLDRPSRRAFRLSLTMNY